MKNKEDKIVAGGVIGLVLLWVFGILISLAGSVAAIYFLYAAAKYLLGHV